MEHVVVGVEVNILHVQVGFLLDRLQINQHQLGGILGRPGDVAVLAVDHGRGAGGLVPDLGLVIPFLAGSVERLVPLDSIAVIPLV